ncbi:MAG: hypothetical protein ACJAS9_001575 [Polaribacter sp.]|jgi:hypothetical protein
MGALTELFSSPEDLLNLGVIVFMHGIAVYFIRMFISIINNDE